MRIYGSEPGKQKREQTHAEVGMGAEMWQQQTVWLTPYNGIDTVGECTLLTVLETPKSSPNVSHMKYVSAQFCLLTLFPLILQNSFLS